MLLKMFQIGNTFWFYCILCAITNRLQHFGDFTVGVGRDVILFYCIMYVFKVPVCM